MNPNNTLPCWADANNNVIFGKPVGTLGTASVLALFLVIASLLGFIAGQRVDMNRVRERVDLDKMKQKLPSVNVEKLKQNGPDVNKLKDNAIGTFGKVKDTTYGAFGQAKDSAYDTFGQMKDSAAGTFGKAKENMTGDGLNQSKPP